MSFFRNNACASAALFACAFAWAAALASCGPVSGLSDSHELRVLLPEFPSSWAFLPDQRIALSWRGVRGERRSISASPGSVVEIEVERGYPQAILAIPSSAGRGLKPAGALYPEDCAEYGGAGYGGAGSRAGEGELSLDWIGGYVAQVAAELERTGVDPRDYALVRLGRELRSRASDPWILGSVEAARRLYERSFRATALDDPKRYACALPVGGDWAPESPFASAPRASGGGASIEAELPEGLWRFLGLDSELIVSVEDKGIFAWALR